MHILAYNFQVGGGLLSAPTHRCTMGKKLLNWMGLMSWLMGSKALFYYSLYFVCLDVHNQRLSKNWGVCILQLVLVLTVLYCHWAQC